MANTTILLTTTKISLIHTLPSLEQSTENDYRLCSLKWKLGKLWVSYELHQNVHLAPLANFQWLKNCLNHSSTQSVCVDLALGDAGLQFWADACHQSKKQMYVRVPVVSKLPQNLYPLRWVIKHIIDRFTAALLLLSLTPIILALLLLARLTSTKALFHQQWSIGKRGKLFQIIKFRTMLEDEKNQRHKVIKTYYEVQRIQDDLRMTPLEHWIYRYKLDRLPQLVNVLRGEMSIVGPRPLNFSDAVQISPENRGRLRALPGMINIVPLKKGLVQIDIAQAELNYLSHWSLLKDLGILIKTVLRMFRMDKS